ncbi:MAG TPA: hypothetical protein VGD91_15205, partial [Trebonia sp.]
MSTPIASGYPLRPTTYVLKSRRRIGYPALPRAERTLGGQADRDYRSAPAGVAVIAGSAGAGGLAVAEGLAVAGGLAMAGGLAVAGG